MQLPLHNITNGCESYHLRLNQRFYSPRLMQMNMFSFIDDLIEIQSETHVKLRITNQKKIGKEQNLREQMIM